MAITLTYLTSLTSGTNASSYSLGNVSPGTDGTLIIATAGRNTTAFTVSSVTVGGNSADIRVDTGSVVNPGVIATYSVTAGTHAIVVNFSATSLRCGCSVWLMTGNASAVPYSSDSNVAAGSASSVVLTMDYPTGGYGIYAILGGSTGITVTWSAASEQYDAAIETNATWAAADKTASGAANDETITFSASMNNHVALSAVWEPAAAGSGNPHYYYQNQAVAA